VAILSVQFLPQTNQTSNQAVSTGSVEFRACSWTMIRDSLVRQGFSPVWDHQDGQMSILISAAEYESRQNWCMVRFGQVDFIAAVGTIWLDGLFGEQALRRIRVASKVSDVYHRLKGEFSLVYSIAGQIGLWTDKLGLNKVYRSDNQIMSTSWLAASASASKRTLNQAAANEYIIFGAPHSWETPIQEVSLVQPGMHVFNPISGESKYLAPDLGVTVSLPKTFSQAIEILEALIVSRFEAIKLSFGGKIRTALSGGYDSRMILAALDRVDLQPSLVVYGDDDDEDVKVARHIASMEHLDLQVTNKGGALRIAGKDDLESLREACIFFDGLPVDGFVDSRPDRQTRLAQNANGYLSLNGGGGEIFRDFFHLPDRRFNADQLFKTFYSQWNPDLFPGHVERFEFSQRFISQIEFASSVQGKNMERWQIEELYANFRCRFWMGRNNTIANRYGTFLTPLFDADFIGIVNRVPMSWKYAGRLQSALIARLSQRIASYPSNYGFSFSEGSTFKYRLRDLGDRLKPIALRPMVSKVRRSLAPTNAISQRISKDYQERFGANFHEIFFLDLVNHGSPLELNRAMSLLTALNWLRADASSSRRV
jgi:hypothetical protein